MKNKFKLLFTILFLSVFGKICNAHEPQNVFLTVQPSVIQGETAFVNVISNSELVNPYLVFKSAKIPMFKVAPNKYRGMIGIDPVIKPGSYSVKVADASNKLLVSKNFNVNGGIFPVQNIVVSSSKSDLEPTSREIVTIQRAKTTVSPKKLWGTVPFDSPTKGCMISVYGLDRYHNGIPSGDYHKGIDIKAPSGQPIYPTSSGKVLVSEFFNLNGGTVIIDHGQGLTSAYLHMSKILVKPGEVVTKDKMIGKVGSTGYSTGPHLHWGLYVNGIPVAPSLFWVKPVSKC